ncbi:MAG: NAD-glutamate dehydrogenase [Alphaproteobacteria bacterium]
MLSMKAREEKSERLAKAGEHARDRLTAAEAEEVWAFISRFYDRIAPEDILEITPENLFGAAYSLWKFAARRPAGQPRIRVYNPRIEEHGWQSPHTVIELVNDDMPFLVDSITGCLSRFGADVHLVIHPVIGIARDGAGNRTGLDDDGIGESLMHIEIDEQPDTATLEKLAADLAVVLADVRAATEDWQPMLERLDEAVGWLNRKLSGVEAEEVAEAREFLTWLRANHFTFLGCRDLREGKDGLEVVEDSGFGILRDPWRSMLARGGSGNGMAPIMKQFFDRPELLLITKTSVRGHVHRAVHMDYVGVKQYDAKGKLLGERRFVGLFTSSAYNRTPRDIPYLRRKVAQALEMAGLPEASHDGKALTNILETYPRDELFQIDLDTLHDISGRILALQERPGIRLFGRRDKFDRYFSCIVYLPRERLSTTLRRRFEKILIAAFSGRLSNQYTQVSDSPLARWHFIIGTEPGDVPETVDYAAIEARLIEAARSWQDDLESALVDRFGEASGNRLAQRFNDAFPAAYTEAVKPELALSDIEKMERIVAGADMAVNFYRAIEDADHEVRFKIYHPAEPVPLSDCLPMLEHMGLKVMGETPYQIHPAGTAPIWVHDFELLDRTGRDIDLARLKDKFEGAFDEIWHGDVEDDGFNRLVLGAGLEWREVVLLRACCKYLRQAGIPFSQAYMEDTLAHNPEIARMLVALFHARFDPARADDDRNENALVAEFETALDAVQSLDEDRILRRFANFVRACLRTNYYQGDEIGRPKSYVAFKLDSTALDELPKPRPFREIFVYSPRVEAVHLRGGKVARGGLRWSDRREDFRTEVLGLMKAQMVKNAVIVPVGSKGGFVPKRLPVGADREAVQAEGIECYKTFIRGLLDITDNRDGDTIVPPADVVRYDDDDPYLVVAADKGTATFSDIANGVSMEYGFWLGDAFASGGAVGYDHKGMGITAKGAWESVKRHFRELGRDIQSDEFTAVGVGDMSGDVFGNGMLLSKHTRLLAAFDHRHIFFDPDPDPAASWAERARMFALPRSSWDDYDKSLISEGGGVFDRRAKSITLTPQLQALTGLDVTRAAPAEIMKALLKAEVDLLWFGGIGTYVKARSESNAEAGDRANDALRVDGRELRAKVIGEGANLGVTQRGRIEYAMAGGRLNTDAVDNSAGVDCSDHEVNIKILVDAIVRDGEMTEKQRNKLLAEMTDNVGELVLRSNYLQTLALSMLRSQGVRLLQGHARFMRDFGRMGLLDREVEFLPSDEEIAERQAAGQGLTRPELSVLLAYAKMHLYDQLLASDLGQSNYLAMDLQRYFPPQLHERFADAIANHRLRGEIIATTTANSIVNRLGITFVHDLLSDTDFTPGDIGRAYTLARDAFAMRELWADIEALDNQIAADLQIRMYMATAALMRRATAWFLRNASRPLRVTSILDAYAPGLRELREVFDDALDEHQHAALADEVAHFVAAGVPEPLAQRVASLKPMGAGCDIVEAASRVGRPVPEVAQVYFAIGGRLGLDWLRDEAEKLELADYWSRTAVGSIVEDLFGQQRALTANVLGAKGTGGLPALDAWQDANAIGVDHLRNLMEDFRSGGALDVARLAVANRFVRRLIVGSA